jgi:hypothetical protein
MRVLFVIVLISCNINLIAQQKINPNLFGFRMSTSFIFFDIKDSSFSNKVIELNPRVLCFPGGFGNFYHFKGAGYGFDVSEVAMYNKGDKAEIGKSLNWISKKKEHTRNYIYDFISLVKRTQSKVIFNINILNEPVEDYIKVLEMFEENDIEVIAIELGGELYTREYKDMIDGELYIQLASTCVNNIKRYYPDILIGVVAAPVNTLRRHNLWNKKLAIEKFYDAIIVHSYAKVTKGNAVAGKMVLEEQESDDKDVAFDIYKQRAINYFRNEYPANIQEYVVTFENKPIWITEWNLQMSKITANTMLQSLFMATYFLEIATNPKLKNIELSTFHNMAGRTLSGSMLLRKNDKTHILSTYRPAHMLSEIFLDENYNIEKVNLSDECFKYVLFQDNNDKKIICWVNWSENEIHTQTLDGRYLQKEYYGKKLFSNTFDQDGIIYREKKETFYDEGIKINPYSITMIIQGEK